MTVTLTPDAALLLRRIIVSPRSELESVHTATDRMTELVDELRGAKLVIMQGGKWVVTPPGTDTWTAPSAVAKLRAVLADGAEDTESAALLTSWSVPMTVPFVRVSDAWLSTIYTVPLRHFRVNDVLRLAPDAGMRGERTPADEVMHWITEALIPNSQITVHSERDGIYTFPEPSIEDLDAAREALRADRAVHPRMLTEMVMRGDAVRQADGTVVPVAPGSPAPVTETPETKPAPETPQVDTKPDTETPKPAGDTTSPAADTKPEGTRPVAPAIGQVAEGKKPDTAAPVSIPLLEKKVDKLTDAVVRVERKLDTLPPPPTAENMLMKDADTAVKALLESVCVHLKLNGGMREAAIHRALPGKSKPTRSNPEPVDKRLRLGEALTLGVDAKILAHDPLTRTYRLITVTNLMSKTELDRRVQRVKDIRKAREERNAA